MLFTHARLHLQQEHTRLHAGRSGGGQWVRLPAGMALGPLALRIVFNGMRRSKN